MTALFAFLAAASPLHTDGAKILNTEGKAFHFAGITVSGFESDPVEKNVIRSVKAAFQDWHANVVRLPLSQDAWFGKDGQTDEGKAYREAVDQAVQIAKGFGGYVILDLAITDGGKWGKFIGVHSMPDLNSAIFWKDVAKTYRSDPNVVFELFDSPIPQKLDGASWNEGGAGVDLDDHEKPIRGFFTPGFVSLVKKVRGERANNLILIDLPERTANFKDALRVAIIDPTEGELAYACHFDASERTFDEFEAAIAKGHESAPLVVTNFIVPEDCAPFDSPAWGTLRSIEVFRQNDLGWIADSAAANQIDQPTKNFGRLVKSALKGEELPAAGEPPKPTDFTVLYESGASPLWTLNGLRTASRNVTDGQKYFAVADLAKGEKFNFYRRWLPVQWLDKIHFEVWPSDQLDMWVSLSGTGTHSPGTLVTSLQPNRWNSVTVPISDLVNEETTAFRGVAFDPVATEGEVRLSNVSIEVKRQ